MIRPALALLILTTATAVVPEYFVIGFTHILPGGLDHILFILGLFFLTKNAGALLLQMTLFTLAHSLTLGLSLYGIVHAPTVLVEVAIALSIAFVAGENLFSDKLSRWRPWVVFGSGLIHGMGFAHSFEETLVDSGDFLPALFSFNMGIEFGQLAVVGIASAAVALWWKRDWYRTVIARPASLMIASAGLYWAVERSIG
ncbi:HupE/UreJ family protein [Luteolibacter yonseiensis]|uniref:HupE/UreJ family protein n=1 Tax=Luteolibacter yonseiensis TaxID=1144680 RepID=A0A934R0T5_9BACT|nr:HupE/UreJ family protein [Luteolibacter yonseiensis]MBK1814246.1 HupE/UreJ family protein [Luteolibacter yonseiensis]